MTANIAYDNTEGGLTSTTVQTALDELVIDSRTVFTEMDDIQIRAGLFENAGSGWQEFLFSDSFGELYEFPGPPTVTANVIGATATFVDIGNITAVGFQYQVLTHNASTAPSATAAGVMVAWQAIYDGEGKDIWQ